MPKRWTDMQAQGPYIQEMRKKGMTRREIAETLGLEIKQIENYITRSNKSQRAEGILPKRRGRPRKRAPTPQEQMTLRIKELEREVSMLRSFLHAAGRMCGHQ